MKAAQNAAGAATTNAVNTGAGYGAAASGADSTLTPLATQEALHPMGYTPQDTSAMLAAGMGGAGGTTSAITGSAAQGAAQSGNASGYTGALDDAARIRAKAAAGSAEGIAADNANLKVKQQAQGMAALGDIAGRDTSAQLQAMGQVPTDINANVNAGQSGWLQNGMNLLKTINGGQ